MSSRPGYRRWWKQEGTYLERSRVENGAEELETRTEMAERGGLKIGNEYQGGTRGWGN